MTCPQELGAMQSREAKLKRQLPRSPVSPVYLPGVVLGSGLGLGLHVWVADGPYKIWQF